MSLETNSISIVLHDVIAEVPESEPGLGSHAAIVDVKMSTRGSIPTYKVCLAGLPGVGKTSLFNSIRGKDFSENPRAEIDNYIHRTTVDFSGKKYEVNVSSDFIYTFVTNSSWKENFMKPSYLSCSCFLFSYFLISL